MASEEESIWDEAADSFDEAPDHGLRDPAVRAAWSALLEEPIPESDLRIADLGCGTGSLAILLAERGHRVSGLDVSSRMVSLAQHKASGTGLAVDFTHGDASAPPFAEGAFDVVLARHVLWVFPDPVEVLRRWIRLLRPGGRLVLIEGRWWTEAGLTADECSSIVRSAGREVELLDLSEHDALWGGHMDDERYLIVSRR